MFAAPRSSATGRGSVGSPDIHEGYAPTVLRHGLHAAVLLTPKGGDDEAYFQPYLAPCTRP